MQRELIFSVVLLQKHICAIIFTNLITFYSKLSFKVSSLVSASGPNHLQNITKVFPKLTKIFTKQKNGRSNISKLICAKKAKHTKSLRTIFYVFSGKIFVRTNRIAWLCSHVIKGITRRLSNQIFHYTRCTTSNVY